MKDLRLEIKFKNNLIYKRISNKNCSLSEFCIKHNLGIQTVVQYLNLRITPISEDKRTKKPFAILIDGIYFKRSAVRLANALECSVFDIFPPQLWDVNSKKYSIELNSKDLVISYDDNLQISSIDSRDEFKIFNFDNLDSVLKSLSEKEEDVLKKRFGMDGYKEKTLREIGNDYNLTPERIRQIECRALRKLRHPSRSSKLVKRCLVWSRDNSSE